MERAFAGLVRLTVETAGVYRISLDQPLWVDVIANGTVVPAKDFQGRSGCNAPHKIVEFQLPAASPITLQFSGSNVPVVKATAAVGTSCKPTGQLIICGCSAHPAQLLTGEIDRRQCHRHGNSPAFLWLGEEK